MATSATPNSDPHRVHQELITGSVVIAAIVMFIWTGGSAMTAVVRYITGVGSSVEQILLTALLLNIALILFGWRRYRDLQIEVEQRREAEERARLLAETDALTGFLNRRSVMEKTTEMLAQATVTHRSIAVLLLDLDNFKAVNDVHGHDAGDRALVTVAHRITALMPPSALVARLGGDEFACVLSFDPEASGEVDRIAGQVVEAMADPMIQNGLQLRIGVSIGIARSETGNESISTLLKYADIAMYWAKKRGRNAYAWFDASMEREFRFRNALEAGIRQGIRTGEFLPYYEPQMDLGNGSLIGFDMLPYWNHPVEGVIPPALFGPFAEENGLVAELSQTVMRSAFEDARYWDPSLVISVPVSLPELKDPWLAQKLCKLLLETGFAANRLELRIGERLLLENFDAGQPLLGSLKNQGVRIALEDFGTVYCSPARLRTLPIDRIRINHGYCASIEQIRENAGIINTVMRLAGDLGVPVIADRIEDRAVADHMAKLGCNHGQGPLFGPAMPKGQVLRLLVDRNLLLPRSSGSLSAGTGETSGSRPSDPERRAM